MVGGASSSRTGILAAFELAAYAADACGDPAHGHKEAFSYQRSEPFLHLLCQYFWSQYTAYGVPFACNPSNRKAYLLHAVNSEPTISRDMGESGENKILLANVEVCVIALDPGIPMDIFSPPVKYEKHNEVKLTLGASRGAPLEPTPGRTGVHSSQTAEENANGFWTDFIAFQKLWEELREQQYRIENPIFH